MRCEGHRIYGEGCDNEATERDSWVDPQHRDTVRALHMMKSGYMEVLHLCQDCADGAESLEGAWIEYIGILETPSDNPNPKVKGE